MTSTSASREGRSAIVGQIRKGGRIAGFVTAGIGVVIGLWYFFSESVPEDLAG